MSHRIKKVRYLDQYRLELLFDNGANKIVDLVEIVDRAQNMLLPLKDLEYFKKVKCDGFSIVWPNGVDLCPDVLYKLGKTVHRKKRKPAKKITKTIFRKRRKFLRSTIKK